MKFAEHLSAHITPEWSSQYIRYDDMKELLSQAIEKSRTLVDENDEEFFLRVDEHFFRFCEKESTKINTFFAEKLAEAVRRWITLKNEIEITDNIPRRTRVRFSSITTNESIDNQTNTCRTFPNETNSTRIFRGRVFPDTILKRTRRKRTDLKLAFSEFYLMLVLLQNYQQLNYTGFRKILKKHDKLFSTKSGEDWRKLHIDSAPFHKTVHVDQLIDEVESLYTDTFESGDRVRALKRLRVPPLEAQLSLAVTFRIGIFIGMLILLFPLVIFLGTNLHDSQSTKPLAWRQALFLYRSSFLILLHIILIGINVYGWSSSGVNHVLIFEIDPRKHLTYQQFLEIGTFLFVFWFLSFVTFILSFYYDFYPFTQPLSFLIFILLFILNPTPTFYHQARFWFLKTLGRVICAPLYHVSFADFWLADQITSLEMIFFDIQYITCFYTYDVSWWPTHFESPTHSYLCHGRIQIGLQTILMMLPSWFRFSQCLRRYHDTKQAFPHLVNAGKYATGFFVLIANSLRRSTMFNYLDNPTMNPFLYIWIGVSLFASTYKLYWDYLMDWGFFSKNSGENRFLRDQLVYPSKFYYYSAICLNFILRYIWIINIFMHFRSFSAEYASVIGFIFGLLEIFRRFIWNYFRLENEHLNNCGNFRAVRDISITPITNSFDHGTLEDMMDRQNGVRNRSKSRKFQYRKTFITSEGSDNETVIIKTPRLPLQDITNQKNEEINTTITVLDSPVIRTNTPDPVL